MSAAAAEGATILVVEDNPDNMKLFAWTLEDEGYAFEGVGSAEEAIDILGRRAFDLVLMDISLPGMDGKEATRRLRADPRFARLPILAVTAHAIKGEAEAILEAGVSALVTKPIDEEALLGTIRAHLARGGGDG
jgi:CheY-like chemotaxis protein